MITAIATASYTHACAYNSEHIVMHAAVISTIAMHSLFSDGNAGHWRNDTKVSVSKDW